MPKQGASSGFKYGRAVGALEAAIALSGIPVQIIEPSMWKRALRLPGKDKEAARQCALELFPAAHALLARKKDHGRAEAALIALYGIKNSRLMTAPSGAEPGSIKQTSNNRGNQTWLTIADSRPDGDDGFGGFRGPASRHSFKMGRRERLA